MNACNMAPGCMGAPGEERRVRGAECLFGRQGAAVDPGSRPRDAGSACRLCPDHTTSTAEQQRTHQGEALARSHEYRMHLHVLSDAS